MLDSLRGAVMQARRHGDLYFAALLDADSITEAFGAAQEQKTGTHG